MKKQIKLSFIIFLLGVSLPAFLLRSPTAAAGRAADTVVSWGISPNSRERTPEPPKNGAKLLAENNGIFVGNTSEKKIYFTFDLGYEAGYTAQVLDILKQNGIKAVFFLCGNYLKETDLINRMINEGHDIGNHTDRHRDLPALSDESIRKDIMTLQEDYKTRYGGTMKFFRPPQGRFSERVLKIANENGLKTTMWSIAIVDWGKTPINAHSSADKIAKRLHPGAIILSHITNSGAPETLKLLLPKITEKGYLIGAPCEL